MIDSAYIIFGAMLVCMFLPFSNQIKMLVIALLVIVLLIVKRASMMYVSAARRIMNGKGDEKKNWEKLAKAVGMGLPTQNLLTAASIYIQKGDWKEGERILHAFLAEQPKRRLSEKAEKQRQAWIATARTMLSMARWIDGDLDGAIAEVKQVYDGGVRNQNVLINYGTYALEKGDLHTAYALIGEGKDMEDHSTGLADNHGWYHILTGNWHDAEKTYDTILATNPSFAEAYVHMAQVRIHQGRIRDAITLLEKAEGCRFTQTSGMKKENITQLKALLEDPKTRLRTARSMDQDVAAVASGKLPRMLEGDFPETDQDTIADGFHPDAGPTETQEAPEPEDPDRVPDTDLDASDEAYLKSHGLD